MAVVALKEVHKSYQTGDTSLRVLEGIDLVIEPGEFVAIAGPSGSGKSTICNLLALLDSPTSGAVYFDDQNVKQLQDNKSSRLRNHHIGIVFQGFNLIQVLSAHENVMLPMEIGNTDVSKASSEAYRLLKEVGLEGFEHQRPQQLSGGQQQRVALARALATDPRLVVADEPTANLDSKTAMQIIDLMRKLNRERGVSFVFATHDERLLQRVSRTIRLLDGQIVEDRVQEAE